MLYLIAVYLLTVSFEVAKKLILQMRVHLTLLSLSSRGSSMLC